MTDVSPDPTEPAPTDLLDFPPLPRHLGRSGEPGGIGGSGGSGGSRASGGPGRSSAAPSRGTAGAAGAHPIRVVPESEATARLRITLPAQAPTPSTALRPQAVWEDTRTRDAAVEAFARVAASPASPSTLPSQLAAMTTATMVIPLPPAVRPGSGLLTTTLPPNHAAQENAARIGDAFRDTIEEIFGVDLDTVDPAELGLPPRREPGEFGESGERPRREHGAHGEHGEFGGRVDHGAPDAPAADGAGPSAPVLPLLPRPVPSEVFGGVYGVPTQQAPFAGVAEPAHPFALPPRGADPNRHALALRYLGGIFHDSSGESSYLDPEEFDQGWIPSAFGAVPPDAPTEQLARVPGPSAPSGRPGAGPAGRPGPRPAPGSVGAAGASGAVGGASWSAGPARPADDATALLPVQSPAYPGPRTRPAARTGARTGTRTANGGRTGTSAGTSRAGAAAARGARGRTGAREATGSSRRARALTVGGLCVAAVAVLYGIALLVAGGVFGGTIPAGVSVDGVPIGGLSPAAARQALEARLDPAAGKPIALRVGQVPVGLDPAKAGLSLDVDATVAAAQAQRTDPFTVIPALFGASHPIDPVVSVDRSALASALAGVAAAYDAPLVEGRITFAGTRPVVTMPQAGRGFDVTAAASAVASGYLRAAGPIVLPVNPLTPRATPQAVRDALDQLARPAVGAPVTVVTGAVTSELRPDQIGAALTIAPDRDGTMVPALDGAMLRADLDPAALATEQAGTNAAFTVDGGTVRLVPEKDGSGYAPQALAAAVAGVLTHTAAADRTVTVPRGPLPPAFTTADAQALGVQGVLGAAALAVPAAPDRAADTAHAVSLVDGSVVQPGALWSFNNTVGAPTAANGFAEPAGSAHDGVDVSGAADLVATAVFDAVFRAGLGDTVHHPDAVYFSRYPVGLDAAVVWPGTDLQWTNTSDHPVYVYAAYANGTLTVDLLGRPAYDEVDVSVSGRRDVVAPTGAPRYGCPAQPASDGFQVDVTRVLMRGGAQVGTEQFHVSYQPYPGTACGSGAAQSTQTGADGGRTSAGSGDVSGAPASGGSGGGGGTGGTAPSPPSQPAPAPSSPGVLGGLLH